MNPSSSASLARSASVTRSMPPLYSMVRTPRNRSRRSAPARRTACSAVSRSDSMVSEGSVTTRARLLASAPRSSLLRQQRVDLLDEGLHVPRRVALVHVPDRALLVDDVRGGDDLHVQRALGDGGVAVQQHRHLHLHLVEELAD